MKKRKRIIILCSILASIVLIVILSSTIFTLSNIGVEYRTTTVYLSNISIDDVVSSGDFNVGKSIFFTDFDESVGRIEKEYPYIKVINVERKFPNSAVINIAERVPVAKIYKNSLDCLILDEELKVLNVVYNDKNFIEETGEEFVPKFYVDTNYNFPLETNFSAGDFLNNEPLSAYLSAFYKGVYAYEKTGMSIIESICLGFDETLNCVIFSINFRNSTVNAIIKSDNDLEEVIRKVTATYILKGESYTSIYSTTDGLVYGVKK